MKRVVKDKGAAKRRLNLESVAEALGGEDTGVEIDTRRGPLSLFTLRQFLVDRLHSAGGRPRLRGTRKRRSKISFFEEDWRKLEKMRRYYREEKGINVTLSQIASALIHAGVSRIDISKIKLKPHSYSK